MMPHGGPRMMDAVTLARDRNGDGELFPDSQKTGTPVCVRCRLSSFPPLPEHGASPAVVSVLLGRQSIRVTEKHGEEREARYEEAVRWAWDGMGGPGRFWRREGNRKHRDETEQTAGKSH